MDNSKFVDYSARRRLTKRKSPNPKGVPLRRMDDCELAVFVNSILDKGNGFDTEPITLKELAKTLDFHYQGFWSAYNSYRKLPLEEMIALHRYTSLKLPVPKTEEQYTMDAVRMYLAQKPPIRGLKDPGCDTDPNAPASTQPPKERKRRTKPETSNSGSLCQGQFLQNKK